MILKSRCSVSCPDPLCGYFEEGEKQFKKMIMGRESMGGSERKGISWAGPLASNLCGRTFILVQNPFHLLKD